MSIAVRLAISILLLVAGFAAGVKYHVGVDAARDLEARELRDTDERQQRKFNDVQAGAHATQVDRLSTQLGNAREKIATLSGRACLDVGTVRVLNGTGVPQRSGAAADEPADAPAAAAAATGLRYSTDRDVAGYIALCRTEYARVADQLNLILDIEDRRHPPGD